MTYTKGNDFIDDVTAQPRSTNLSQLKPEADVLNSNIHRVKLGHSGITNDYATTSAKLREAKPLNSSNDSRKFTPKNMFSSNFEIGKQEGQQPLKTSNQSDFTERADLDKFNIESARTKLQKSNFEFGNDPKKFNTSHEAME